MDQQLQPKIIKIGVAVREKIHFAKCIIIKIYYCQKQRKNEYNFDKKKSKTKTILKKLQLNNK